jgi:excisionase family DNA binding protein
MNQENTSLLRIKQVCTLLAISKSTVYRMIKAKKLKAPIKIGDRIVCFKSKDIENFINSKSEANK